MIYYGASNGLIKIGYTESQLQQRTTAHRATRPDYIVLAARDGDMAEEHRTHRMFCHLRVDGELEWFHPGPDLLAHLCVVARGDYRPPVEIPIALAERRPEMALPADIDF